MENGGRKDDPPMAFFNLFYILQIKSELFARIVDMTRLRLLVCHFYLSTFSAGSREQHVCQSFFFLSTESHQVFNLILYIDFLHSIGSHLYVEVQAEEITSVLQICSLFRLT